MNSSSINFSYVSGNTVSVVHHVEKGLLSTFFNTMKISLFWEYCDTITTFLRLCLDVEIEAWNQEFRICLVQFICLGGQGICLSKSN
jgi:hypothetical protein